MSTATNTGLVIDEVTPLLERVNDAATAKGLALVGARAGASLVRAHLVGLNGERHRGGGNNFYAKAARSVSAALAAMGAAINISLLGFRQRLLGGDITAGARGTGKKWLPISARSETYGKEPGEFNDLHFVLFRADLAALVQNEQTSLGGPVRGSVTRGGRVKRETLGGGIFYWLKKHVHQEPDPTVLPPDFVLATTVLRAIATEMNRLAGGKI